MFTACYKLYKVIRDGIKPFLSPSGLMIYREYMNEGLQKCDTKDKYLLWYYQWLDITACLFYIPLGPTSYDICARTFVFFEEHSVHSWSYFLS